MPVTAREDATLSYWRTSVSVLRDNRTDRAIGLWVVAKMQSEDTQRLAGAAKSSIVALAARQGGNSDAAPSGI